MLIEGEQQMKFVGVRFVPTGRVHYFEPAGLDLDVGDRVAVMTDDGQREGTVTFTPDQVLFSELRGPLEPVLRVVQPARG